MPGTHAPIPLEFRDTAGSSCGALLPTGNAVDVVEGVRVTLIGNGMPCVVMKAADVGVTGYEDRETLDGDSALKVRIEAIRPAVGARMNLGDVRDKSVPKMMLVAPPLRSRRWWPTIPTAACGAPTGRTPTCRTWSPTTATSSI